MSFPSPHGDKFQLRDVYCEIVECTFPSPHGDKFQRSSVETLLIYAVSVPSRG